ncbi:MAG: hypothetical protein NC095_06170 [Muribaculum sp.]|nr:hypothetical protein [Muribaculum sp.]
MAKVSGGTRNYSHRDGTLAKRRGEFNQLMESGYDRSRSYMSPKGGFKAVHPDHNAPGVGDKAEERCNVLADKGYRVYLDSERSEIEFQKVKDGRFEKFPMDTKTINETGKYTIKRALESAAKQGARVVVLIQDTKAMTRDYVESQLKLFSEKSPKLARDKIEWAIVVGLSGNVHRHKLK